MTDVMALAQTTLLNGMERLNVISHNLANANTAGFKRDIVVTRAFEQHLVDGIERSFVSDAGEYSTLGSSSQVRLMDGAEGVFRNTGNTLDIAIEGEGYFQLAGDDGEFLYTRNGSFKLDARGRLVNSTGLVVNGQGGEIRIGNSNVYIDKQGQVWDSEDNVGRIRVVKFERSAGMEKIGAGLFRTEAHPVDALDEEQARLRQGFLETSNVVAMDEMVKMISTMRELEMTQRMVKGYDEMLETAINTLGEV